jgi:hypothetical protein
MAQVGHFWRAALRPVPWLLGLGCVSVTLRSSSLPCENPKSQFHREGRVAVFDVR